MYFVIVRMIIKSHIFFISAKSAEESEIPIAKHRAKFNGKCLYKIFEKELQVLEKCIIKHHPKIIITMGATATWAILDKDAKSQLNGKKISHTVYYKDHSTDIIVLPTWHPSYAGIYNKAAKAEVIATMKRARKLLGGSYFATES